MNLSDNPLEDISTPKNSSYAKNSISILGIIFLYLTYIHSLSLLPIFLATLLFILGVDGAYLLGQKLKRERQVPADYFFSYISGAVFIIVGVYISFPYLSTLTTLVPTQIPFARIISSIGFGAIYTISVTSLIKWQAQDDLIVEKDPDNLYDRYYIFLQSEYESRTEDEDE